MSRDYNIQGLRALAAYGVVLHHVIFTLHDYVAIGRFTANPSIGSTGVDIFFVISGYVMALTTSRKNVKPHVFLRHRFTRIAPMYWLLTAIATTLIMVGFKLFGTDAADFRRIATSFLFLPNFQGSHHPKDPILFPGWTLNYEMMFYLIFSLWLIQDRMNVRIFGAILSIVILWFMQVLFRSSLLDYLGADIILSFACGIILYPLTQHRHLPISLLIAAIPLALAGLATIDMTFIQTIPHNRLLVTLGASLLVYSAMKNRRDIDSNSRKNS